MNEELDVVILPSREVSQKAVELSGEIAKDLSVFFTLHEQERIPHISIYQAAYPTKNISGIKTTLRDICAKSHSFPIELLKSSWEKEGWIAFDAHKSKDLSTFHQLVVEKLNPLREGNIMLSDKENLNLYSTRERENVEQYGYVLAMDLFQPHLTITRLKESNENIIAATVQKLEGSTFTFRADTIALCTLGKHGTCVSILEIWNFK